MASRERGPGEALEERQAVAAITRVLDQLPDALRDPLLRAMQGRSGRAIGEELGFSESTARRRISEARDQVRDGIAVLDEDARPTRREVVVDPVLERSQRLFEQLFGPVAGPAPGRGPSR